ncbi:MAG: alpha/beta hydrolase [Pirellulales bacterium]|nr:alpha/beta hydrolase [Pirellulales bacterium]
MICSQKILPAFLLILWAAALPAAEPKIELLWPAGAPGAKGDTDNDKPKLQIYVPEKQTSHAGIVICPGGGYGHLAMGHEGTQVAQWLNSLGIAAFVLDYRHQGRGYGHPAPLDDAQRAIRTVRSRANEFGIDPKKVGIMGFSAGGHLASTAGTHFDAGNLNAKDAIDRVSCRPDFMILCYPAVTLTDPYTHAGSRKNLLGDKPDPELVKSLSNETQVTSETPQTFLFHTNGDEVVVPENSVLFYLALRKAKVPAELHIYQDGGHGSGLAVSDPILTTWKERLRDWLKSRSLLGGE